MHKGLARLYSGDFNNMHQEWQADGSVIITLSKKGDATIYKLHVKELFGEAEELLDYQESSGVVPAYIQQRLEEAKQYGKRKK